MAYRWTDETEADLRRLWTSGVPGLAIQRHFGIGQETMDSARKRLGLLSRVAAFWTPQREADAKRLYIDEGRSAGETARLIGAASRNAIIGVAHRRGWMMKGRKPPAAPQTGGRIKAPKVDRSHIRPPKPGPQKKPALIIGQTFVEGPGSDEARAAFRKDGLTTLARVDAGAGVVSPNARPWTERRSGQCNWPLGERGEVMACCNPVSQRGWCEGHFLVGTTPRPMVSLVAQVTRLTRHDLSIDLEKQATGPGNRSHDRSAWDEGRAAA